MDYKRLNKQTIKNNYPLPLIMDLVDSMGNKRVFTKIDLQWGYNNVRIKEGDEWKAAFTTYVELYKPVVMFFGMMNSSATFQGMMNKILRDMINEEKVTAFVDNILIGTEIEEGYEEIVEEVLRRLKENDLLDKVKKYETRDDKVIKAVEEIKQAGIKMLRDEEWCQEDGLILKEKKVYVPKDKKLKAEVIRLHYDIPVGGHGRQ